MVAPTRKKSRPKTQGSRDLVQFTDREAVRLVTEEANASNETRGKVAARCIIRYFATRIPVSGSVT